jgi:hypothetical protein
MTETHYHPCDTATCAQPSLTAVEVVAHAEGVVDAAHREGVDCGRSPCLVCATPNRVWSCMICRTPTDPGRTVCIRCGDIP